MNIFVVFAALRGTAMGLFLPVWILYLSDQGFDLLAIGLFGTIFEITKLIFEIPTGSFADKKGVRKALLYSYALSIITWGLFPAIHVTWVCVLAMCVWALADALISGAFETWMSQVVKEDFGKYLLRNTQVLLVCIIIVSVITGHLYKYNNVLPFLLVAVVYAVLLILTLIFCCEKPSYEGHEDPEEESFLQIIRASFRLVLSHRRVLNVVLAGFFAALTYDVFSRYWQPYLSEIGFDGEIMGYVMALSAAVAFFLIQFTVKMMHMIEKYTLLSMTLVELVGVVLIILSSLGFKSLGIVSTTLLLAVEDIRNPIVRSYLNKYFPDSYKATLFSINSGMGAAGEVLSGVIFGVVAVKFGLASTFLFAGITLLPTLFLYYNAARIKEKKDEKLSTLNTNS